MPSSDVEKNIQYLVDLEAIKRLRSLYSYYADAHDSKKWANLFTDDGVFETDVFGTHEGRINLENLAALGEKIQAAQLEYTTAELLERMLAEDVPAGPVLSLEELFDDPQLRNNEAILEFDHPTAGRFHQARPAARFDKTPQDPYRHMPPLHGEHTDEVLRELGYDDAELERMRTEGVILSGS